MLWFLKACFSHSVAIFFCFVHWFNITFFFFLIKVEVSYKIFIKSTNHCSLCVPFYNAPLNVKGCGLKNKSLKIHRRWIFHDLGRADKARDKSSARGALWTPRSIKCRPHSSLCWILIWASETRTASLRNASSTKGFLLQRDWNGFHAWHTVKYIM